MPTLEAGSRLDNISRSVNVYVQAQLATGLGLKVFYQGQDRIGTLPQRWIEADLLPGDAIEPVSTGSGILSQWTQAILNLNCYETIGTGATNLYALVTMVENVRNKFLVSTAIPVYDYTTIGNPWAGALMVWERPDVTEVPIVPDAGIKQINISVPLRYHEVIEMG